MNLNNSWCFYVIYLWFIGCMYMFYIIGSLFIVLDGDLK